LRQEVPCQHRRGQDDGAMRDLALTEIFNRRTDAIYVGAAGRFGVVTTLSRDHMVVRFGASALRRAPIGERMMLSVHLEGLCPAFTTQAWLVTRRDARDTQLWTFALRTPIAVPIPNRRRAFRVAAAGWHATINTPGGARATAQLLNLSLTGAALMVDRHSSGALPKTGACKISLELGERGVDLKGRILYRSETKKGSKVGVAFCALSEADSTERTLRRFIMQRQRLASRKTLEVRADRL